MMTAQRQGARSRPAAGRNDEGAALLFVLLGMAVLTAVGMSLVGLGVVTRTMTNSERETAEALAIADAGMAHARRLIMWGEWASLNQIIQNGNGTACDGDELAAAPPAPLPTGYPTASTAFIPVTGVVYGAGRYTVVVCDDHVTESTATSNPTIGLPNADPNTDVNRQIIVRVTGTGRNGATATVEMVIGPVDAPAVIVNGNLSVPGTPNVMGLAGIIHANGTMDTAGDSCTEQYFGSVDTITTSGNSLGGGAGCANGSAQLRPNSTPITLPVFNPIDFKPMADFWLENNGTVLSGVTGLPIPMPAGLSWNAGSKLWSTGTNIPAGTYYANANVSVAGSPGSPASPRPLTIIAEGYIMIGGSPDTVPDLCVPYIGCISALAGTDLDLMGAGNSFSGLYYARHQIDISGNPNITGQVLALNEADTCNPGLFSATCNIVMLDAMGRMVLTGSPTITFNGNGVTATAVRKWRECRGLVPTAPCGPLYANQPSSPVT